MLKVSVEGVREEDRQVASEEITQFFSPSFDVSMDFDLEASVPADFDGAVNALLASERGVDIPYSARRHEVIAEAKTVPVPRDGRLAFVLLLQPWLFQGWDWRYHLTRLLVFVHESIHMRDDISRYRAVGHKAFFAHPTKVRDTFLDLAHSLVMEYRAERLSMEDLLRAVEAAKTQHPGAIFTVQRHERVHRRLREVAAEPSGQTRPVHQRLPMGPKVHR